MTPSEKFNLHEVVVYADRYCTINSIVYSNPPIYGLMDEDGNEFNDITEDRFRIATEMEASTAWSAI